MTSWKEKIYP